MVATYSGYQQLDKASNEIRVMRIHGGDGLVACSLESVRLRDASPFYALSYEWGPKIYNNTILLNGQELPLRKTLWSFLCTLRRRFCQQSEDGSARTLRVWADFLCINQEDDNERSYQVSIMGEIYKAADAVYAWLGTFPDLQDAGTRWSGENGGLRAECRQQPQYSAQHRSIDPQLSEIASSTYWRRLWIKQEILLARDIWLFFGEDVVNWKMARSATKPEQMRPHYPTTTSRARRYGRPGPAISKSSPVAPKSAMMSILNLKELQSGEFSLPDLISRFRDAECGEPRDRIYALLFLIDEETKEKIVVDYKKPLLQVLLETYPHWTHENLPHFTAHSSKEAIPCYDIHRFSIQMPRVLHDAELDSLSHSAELRQDVVARGIFTTSVLREITSVCVVAVMDRDRVLPFSHLAALDPTAHGFVMQIGWRLERPRSNAREYKSFIFAHSAPREGDRLAEIGSRIVFFRQRLSTAQHDTGGTQKDLDVLSTGTVLTASTFMRTQSVFHPCHWLRQQLPDATFEVADGTMLPTKQILPVRGIHVLCNASAMLTFLLEPRWGETDRTESSQFEDDRSGCLGQSEPSAPRCWSPYAFGIQHQTLIPCGICQRMESDSETAAPEMAECECRWMAEVTSSP